MQVYEIEELHSSEDEQALWVSTGFVSDLNDLDVLHIVCAKEIDEKDTNTDLEGIYFERFDQGYSC